MTRHLALLPSSYLSICFTALLWPSFLCLACPTLLVDILQVEILVALQHEGLLKGTWTVMKSTQEKSVAAPENSGDASFQNLSLEVPCTL